MRLNGHWVQLSEAKRLSCASGSMQRGGLAWALWVLASAQFSA